MRLPTFVLCAASILMPGCLQGLDEAFTGNLDCTSAVAQRVSQTTVLYPAAATGESSPAENPRISVHARAGQTLLAQATWQPIGGAAEVAFDGPDANVTRTALTWSSYGTVGAGNYTLGLQGAPFAFDVRYTLQLIASGCTSQA